MNKKEKFQKMGLSVISIYLFISLAIFPLSLNYSSDNVVALSEHSYVDIIPDIIIYNETEHIYISNIRIPEKVEYEQDFVIYVNISSNWSREVFIVGGPGLTARPLCPFGEGKNIFVENGTSVVELNFHIDKAFSKYAINNTLPTVISIYNISDTNNSYHPLCMVAFSLNVQNSFLNVFPVVIVIAGLLIFSLILFIFIKHHKSSRPSPPSMDTKSGDESIEDAQNLEPKEPGGKR